LSETNVEAHNDSRRGRRTDDVICPGSIGPIRVYDQAAVRPENKNPAEFGQAWVMQRRKFSREFKVDAVKLVRERGVGGASRP
jgi:hypothetical protein